MEVFLELESCVDAFFSPAITVALLVSRRFSLKAEFFQVCLSSHLLVPKIQSLPVPELSPASLTTVLCASVPLHAYNDNIACRCVDRFRHAGILRNSRPIQGRQSSRRLRVSHHRWRCWRFERFSGLYVAIRICSILTFINSGHQRSAG